MNTTDYGIFFSDDDDEISMSINSNENTLQSQKRDGEVVILRNKVNQMEAEHFKTINKLSQRMQEMKREFEKISIAKEKEIERLKIESSFMENEISSRILQSNPSSAANTATTTVTAKLTQNPPNFDSDLLFRPKKSKKLQSEFQSKEEEQQQKQLPKDSIHTIINKTHHHYITKENISKEDKRTISECRDLIEKYLTPVSDYSVITTVLKIVYEGPYGRKIVLLPFILSLILNCLSSTAITTTTITTNTTTTITTFLKEESLSIIENLLLGNQKSKNTFMTSIRIMIAVKGTSSLKDDFLVGGRIVECFLCSFFRNTFEDIFNLSEILKLAQITFQQNRQQFRKVKFVEQINQFLRTVIGDGKKRFKAVESLLFEEVIYKFWYLKIAPIGLLLEPMTLRLLVRSLYSSSVYYDSDNTKPQNHCHHKLLLPIFYEWICVEMAPIIPLLGREIFNLSRFVSESLLENPNSFILQKLDKTITDSLVSL